MEGGGGGGGGEIGLIGPVEMAALARWRDDKLSSDGVACRIN